jgi:Transmembrane amino acid transporter protein
MHACLILVGIAAAIPNLGPFISLVGAVCLSTLGLMFPAIIEVVTFWEQSAGKDIYLQSKICIFYHWFLNVLIFGFF